MFEELQNVTMPDEAIANFRDGSRFWIQRVAVPVITVIGMFGNTITIIIMTRKGMRSTTNLYLAALAFCDMLYLVLTFLLGLEHYPNMAAPENYLYWSMKPYLMMSTDACSNTSVWLTVTFTIERYIAVKYPIKGKVWCTESRAKLLILSVFIVGISFATPVPFEWQLVKRYMNNSYTKSSNQIDQSKNESNFVWALDYSDFGKNDTYKTIYYRSTAAIFYIIPLILLIYFNGCLISSVHQSRRERSDLTGATTSRNYIRKGSKSSSMSMPKVIVGLSRNGENGGYNNDLKLLEWRKKTSQDSYQQKQYQSNILYKTEKSDSNLSNKDTDRDFVPNEPLFRGNSNPDLISARSSGPNVQNKCDKVGLGRNSSDMLMHVSKDTDKFIQREIYSETTRLNPEVVNNSTRSSPVRRFMRIPNIINSNSHSHNSGPGTPHTPHERRITIMLISVVILFLCCQLPSAMMILYTATRDLKRNTNEHALVLAFGNIFNFLMAVNSAGNFILYSLLSKKYRRTFMKLFCNCFKNRDTRSNINSRLLSVKFESMTNSLRSKSNKAQLDRSLNNKLDTSV